MSRAVGGCAALLVAVACSASVSEPADTVDVEVAPVAATSATSATGATGAASSTGAASATASAAVATATAVQPMPPVAPLSGVPVSNASQVPASLHPKLTAGLAAQAQTAASGMTPLSPPQVVEFDPGEVFVTALQLDAGRCYTFLASLDGIQRLELQVLAGPMGLPMPPMPIAMAVGGPPSVSIGPGSSCFKNPLPMPMPASLVVTAAAGKGAAAVQVFSK